MLSQGEVMYLPQPGGKHSCLCLKYSGNITIWVWENISGKRCWGEADPHAPGSSPCPLEQRAPAPPHGTSAATPEELARTCSPGEILDHDRGRPVSGFDCDCLAWWDAQWQFIASVVCWSSELAERAWG